MKIGFDLDGIFIDRPPLVPKSLLEWLYRGPQNHVPKYRFPSTNIEQKIRKWSHQPVFRQKISTNIEFLKELSINGDYEIFLISSRYNFLTSETNKILKLYNFKKYFSKIYLNSQDLQPHLFKESVLKKINLSVFIDDDLLVIKYLNSRLSKTSLLWYNPGREGRLSEGIVRIKALKELYSHLK